MGAKLIKPDPRAVTNNGKSAQWLPINGTVRETIHIDNPTQYDMLFQYTNLKNGRTRPVRYGAVGCGQEPASLPRWMTTARSCTVVKRGLCRASRCSTTWRYRSVRERTRPRRGRTPTHSAMKSFTSIRSC